MLEVSSVSYVRWGRNIPVPYIRMPLRVGPGLCERRRIPVPRTPRVNKGEERPQLVPVLALPVDVFGKKDLRHAQEDLSGLALVVQIEPVDVHQDNRLLLRKIEHLAAEAEDRTVVSAEVAKHEQSLPVSDEGGVTLHNIASLAHLLGFWLEQVALAEGLSVGSQVS